MNNRALVIDGFSLTVDMVKSVAREHTAVEVSRRALEAMSACRSMLDRLVKGGAIIYGVTTGMGGMREFLVPDKVGPEMQMNLLRAVATNVGDRFPEEAVRAAMLARLNSLSRGHSAIQIANFRTLLAMLNSGIHPVVPRKGSLGTSGDLGPLAAISLAATGEGMVEFRGEIVPASQALEIAGIAPMKLQYKEGLALINGTSMMSGLASLVIADMETISCAADVIAAFSVEGLEGRVGVFDERVHRQKPHTGQLITAVNIQRMTCDSKMSITDEQLQAILAGNHKSDGTAKSDTAIMDAYSIRCVPQVHGPVKDYLGFARQIVERELNSSNDDPLVITEFEKCFHNGHFHGQYISMAMDSVAVGATALGMISDRRIDRYMDKNHNSGLPSFLCSDNLGVRMGLMGGQFMTSSIVAENRAKCTPMAIQSIPSTEDFQDFVSLGLVSARRTCEVVHNTAYVLAFEAICGAQAADLRGAEKLGSTGRKTYELVRQHVPFLERDVSLTPYLEEVARVILDGQFTSILPH